MFVCLSVCMFVCVWFASIWMCQDNLASSVAVSSQAPPSTPRAPATPAKAAANTPSVHWIFFCVFQKLFRKSICLFYEYYTMDMCLAISFCIYVSTWMSLLVSLRLEWPGVVEWLNMCLYIRINMNVPAGLTPSRMTRGSGMIKYVCHAMCVCIQINVSGHPFYPCWSCPV